MANNSRPTRLPESTSELIKIEFEGRLIDAYANDSVASAVLASGERWVRTTPVTNSPRGPFCMMGVCFECLVEIDGVANLQGCMIQVKNGMRIRRMRGARSVCISSSESRIESTNESGIEAKIQRTPDA